MFKMVLGLIERILLYWNSSGRYINIIKGHPKREYLS